ncbi:MAG: hypothetical protein KatS3mg089_1012 [Patescibacteria group bacterium]|nr:MAG: hypothetical protein KatS3mg089_1012 [Patescibacteria group bacterium]
MDKALKYLKVNPKIAFEYSQAWSELLEKFPFLISISSKKQWREFCENHQQPLEEFHQEFPTVRIEDLWLLGPLSTQEDVQEAILKQIEDEVEKSQDEKQNKKQPLPYLSFKAISGSLVIKDKNNKEIPLAGATIIVKDIPTKKEIDQQMTNSEGRFRTKPLFLKRYLLEFQHPALTKFNNRTIHRVVNLRYFQPPLKIVVFNTMPSFTDAEQAPSENNQPTPYQADGTNTTSDKTGVNQTGDDSELDTPEKQILPSTQIDAELVPFVFITSPTRDSILVSQKAAFQPLSDFNIEIPFSEEIKQDPSYQQLREEQIKRWEAENHESINSVKGQDYILGKGSSSLDKDTLALFVRQFPQLAQKYKDQEANKIYQDQTGKVSPESDPIFQKLKAEVDKAMNRVLEDWERSPTTPPIPLQRATIEAILPYYRYFAEHFPKKASAYAQFDNALNFVVGLLKKQTTISSTSENKQSPSSPVDLDSRKISIDSSENLVSDNEKVIGEEESSDEDDNSSSSSSSSSNKKENRSQNLTQSAEKSTDDRSSSPSRSRSANRPLRSFSRPPLPQKQLTRMLGARVGQAGRLGISSAARIGGLAARAAPLLAHPATWIVIAILLILLILLLTIGGDESTTEMQGRFTEVSKNTTDQQVTNPESQTFCRGRNCATVQGASTSARVLAAMDTNLFEAISDSLKAVGDTVDKYQQELQKIAERIKESQITYTIRVVYEGQAEDIIVTDPIPENALFISASGKYTTKKEILPNGLEKVTAVIWSVRENQGMINNQSGSSSGQLTGTPSTSQASSVNFNKYTQSPYNLPPPNGPSDINFSESQMNDMNTLGSLVAKYQSYLRTKVKNGDPKYIDPFLSVIWTGAVEGIGGYRFFWNCQDTHKEINRGCIGGYYSGGWQVGYGIQVSQATSHIVEDFEAAYGQGSASNPSKVKEVGQRVINDSGGKITNPPSFPEIALTTLASRAQSGDSSAQQAIAILLMDKDLGAIALAREIASDIAANDNWRSTMEGWAPYYKQFMQTFSNRAKALADKYKGIPMSDNTGTVSTFAPQEFTITILPLVRNDLFYSSRAIARAIGGQGNPQSGEKTTSTTNPPNPNATCPGVGPITCGTKQGSAVAPACHCTASYQASVCSMYGGVCDYCAAGVDSASYAIDITNPLNGPVYIPKISINGEAHSVTCKGYNNQTGKEPDQVIQIVSCSDDITDEPIWMQFHHSRKSNPVEVDKYYKSGDVVGYSGSFQVFNSGPHVHFQIGIGGPCGFDGIQGCRNADQYVKCN